ncbi:unnamed protein product [Paramecium sonneborni]|uniref:Uncharacterized protein n=1 Tax=Paramecium sonneborni TaxID=65129 RepID=A0A8S1RLJ6_9CILI|nr:unnamed protein product [Paramecium sonneborni]
MQNELICQKHPHNQITLICTEDDEFHSCQRRLCSDCIHLHGGDASKLIPIQQFNDHIKLKQEKLEHYFLVSKRNFFKQYDDIEKKLKDYLENTRNSAEAIFNELILENLHFKELISSCRTSDLNEIFQGKKFDTWKSLINSIVDKLSTTNLLIGDNLQQLISKHNDEVSQIFWQEKVQIYDGFQMKKNKKIKTKFLVKFNRNHEIIYIHDGEILKKLKFYNLTYQPEIVSNLEIIQHFNYFSGGVRNNYNIGKQYVYWKGQVQEGVFGEYSMEGKKVGLWKIPIQNFWDEALIFMVGEYVNDQRNGQWDYIFEEQDNNNVLKIKSRRNGGWYNQQGLKDGNWLELSEISDNHDIIFYEGNYQNGKKFGGWKMSQDNDYKGSFNNQGQKIGKWYEMNDFSFLDIKISCSGNYENGVKIGKWQSFYCNEIIGEGEYTNDGLKQGEWKDFWEGFSRECQVVMQGQYENNKKINEWTIFYKRNPDQKFEKIGGGIYDQNGMKTGEWIDLSDNFNCFGEVFHLGKYKNNKKIGRWITRLDSLSLKEIGGGQYNQDGVKDGEWTEVSDDYSQFNQVTFKGVYKIGQKNGLWKSFLEEKEMLWFIQSKRFKKWLLDKFMQLILYVTVFYNNVVIIKMVSRMVNGTQCIRQRIKMSLNRCGGDYQNGQKEGDWTDVDSDFRCTYQVTHTEKYSNGRKNGQFQKKERKPNKMDQRFILCD